MSSSLEPRLSYLESRVEATTKLTKDVLGLKGENVELQTKVFELTEENSQLLMKFKELESKFDRMRKDLSEVFGFRDDIVNRLNCLESNVKFSENIHDRVSNLETDINEASQKMTRQNQSFIQRLDVLERQRNTTDRNMPDSQEQTPPKVLAGDLNAENKQEKTESNEQPVMDRLDGIEKQIKELKAEDRLTSIEQESSRYKQSTNDRLETIEQESSSYKQSTKDRLNNFEKQIKELKAEDILTSIEQESSKYKQSTNVRLETIEQESSSYKQSTNDRLNNFEKQIEDLKAEDRLKTIENDMNVVKQESTRNKQTSKNRMNNLERQAKNIQDGVKDIENRYAQYTQSVTGVGLKPSQQITSEQKIRLDKIEGVGVNRNGGYFDVNSCTLQPQVDGDYAVVVTFIQGGDGEIKMVAKTEGTDGVGFYFGKTCSQNDVCSAMHMRNLKKGQKLYLEVERTEGNAYIHWCVLYSWLL